MGIVKYTGSMASFHCPTNAEIRSLKVHFSPKQEGTGDPSPENVREIVGWDGIEVQQSQNNLLNGQRLAEKIAASGGTIDNITKTIVYSGSVANSTGIILDKFNYGKYTIIAKFTSTNSNPNLNMRVYYSDNSELLLNTSNAIEIGTNIYKFTTATNKQISNIKCSWIAGTTTLYFDTFGVYEGDINNCEPYHGSTTNYEFGVLGKNKVPWISPDGLTKNTAYNGTSDWSAIWTVPKNANGMEITYSADIDNTNGADSAYLHIWTKDENDSFVDTTICSAPLDVGSSGRLSKTITLNTNRYSYVMFGLTMNNATASHPMVELGPTATTYEPYDPNHTVYGGWVDLITGEVWSKYKTIRATWGDYTLYNSTSYNDNYEHRRYICDTSIDKNGGGSGFSDVAKKIWSDALTSSHFYIGNSDIHMFLPTGTSSDLEVNVYAKLSEPILVGTLAPITLQTFLGQNNVWSNADYVEVEYDLHETQDILNRKAFIVANQPHIVKPAAASLQNFKTEVIAPLKECKVNFGPVQDLHRYSNPWPAGGEKNIAKPYDNSYVSSTYISFDYSAANGTFRCYGTASASSTHSSPSATNAVNNGATFTLPAGTYTLSIIDGDGANIYAQCVSSAEVVLAETTSYTTFTTNESLTVFVRLKVAASATVDKIVKIQLEKGSSATSYVPYENVCPISGWNQIIIGKTSKNLLDIMQNNRINHQDYTCSSESIICAHVLGWNSTHVWFEQIFAPGTYTISCDYSGEGTNGPRMICSTPIDGGTWNNSYQGYWKNFTGRSCTFTTTEPFSPALVFISRTDHNGESGTFYNIQLELSPTATKYEPYNGETIPITFPATTNLFDEQWEQGNIEVGNDAGSSTCMRTNFINVNPSTSYYLYTPRENNVFVFEYLEDGTYANKVNSVYTSHTFTTGSTTKKIRIVDRNSGTETVNTGINYPATITYYEPYGTIYGGYVDLETGEVWETHKKKQIVQNKNDGSWNSWGTKLMYNTSILGTDNEKHKAGTIVLSDTLIPIGGTVNPQHVTSLDEIRYYGVDVRYPQYFFMANPNELSNTEWRNWLYNTYQNAHVCYELETPILLATLTPTQLKTLRGKNNIWSNANGNIEIKYWTH